MIKKVNINKIQNYSIEEIFDLVDKKLTDKFTDPAERVQIVDIMGQQIIKEAFMQILIEVPDVTEGERANKVREYMDKNDSVNMAKECVRLGVDVGKIFAETAESVLKTVMED